MATIRPDRDCITPLRNQQTIHDISANNGSFVFAGDISHVNFSQTRQVPLSFEDVIKKCRDALFISHPDADRASIADTKGQRAPGTCEWILENCHYQAWLDKKSPLFWLSGGPGTGKTVISLFLLEQVEKMCQGTDDHLLFYFCRFQHEYYNKPENLLRSLAYELLSFSTDKSRTLEVLSYLDTKEKAENALSSLECLWKILEILLSQSDLSTVYCIVDGVDECQSSDVLICKFRDYCASAVGHKGPLRLALLGRDLDTLGIATHSRRPSFPSESTPEPIFAEISAMNAFNGIKLDPDHGENVNRDIARFTRWSLGSLQGIHGFENIRSQIEQILLARAEGTFLWVNFVVHELSRKRTCLQVLQTIQDIPPGLHPIFRRMLHQIDPKHHHISAEILRWIAIAMRPLTLGELAYAIGSGIEGMADIIAICQPLLKQIDGRVLFVHQSAKEYLLRNQPDEDPIAELFRVEASKCHGEIAHRCLQILENSFLQHKIIRFSKSQLNNIKRGHEHHQLPAEVRSASELFNYAYLHWMKHARLSPKEAKHLFDFDRPFFREPSAIRQNWAVSLNLPLRRLQLASYLCIVPWLRALREERGKSFYGNRRWKNWVNSGYQGQTLLDFAVKGNCEEAVRFLLDHGADMEGEFPALWNAISLGRDRMVQILLEDGATIDGNSKDRGVLIAAAREGLLTVVQLLLNHGADINIKNDDNETPLIMAARFAHEDLVLLLVGQGARFNVADFRVWLRKMAQIPGKRWSTGVVQTILHHVTDICWRGEDGGILLSLAVAFADHEIIQVCLAKGVDVNWKHPNGATALIEAMLEWGSGDLNIYYRYSGYLRRDANHINKKSPTMIAGRLAIAAVLMDHGADLNVSADFNDDSQRPLLVTAASLGVDWAVQALIEYGADCNARAMVIRNPESTRPRFASVFRRVSNEQGPEDIAQGGSALIYAARWGYVSTLRLLLAHGADTSFVDEYGKTALEWALEFEHREIEQMLMEHDKAIGSSVRR